jgi:hypothetical protein
MANELTRPQQDRDRDKHLRYRVGDSSTDASVSPFGVQQDAVIANLAGTEIDNRYTAEGTMQFGTGPGDSAVGRLPFWNVEWSGATAYPDGTSYASMTDSTTAILAGIAKAKALGIPAVASGTFRAQSTVTIDSNADFGNATFVCNDSALAPLVRIGTATSGTKINRIQVVAPSVINEAQVSGSGWTGASVGYELANLNACGIILPYAKGFTIGELVTAYGTGNAYNVIRTLHLQNNKQNIVVRPADTSAWTNENTFLGGRLGHDSAEGSSVSGARHILQETIASGHIVNNNRFVNLSVEGDTPEYHVESIGAAFTTYEYLRWEATTPKVWFNQTSGGTGSTDNLIFYGYNAHQIAITESAASVRNVRFGRSRIELEAAGGDDGVLVITNSGSTAYPAITMLAASDSAYQVDAATAYLTALGPQYWSGKRTADTTHRIRVNTNTGAIEKGYGSASFPNCGWYHGLGSPEGVLAAGVGSIYSRTDGGAGTSFYVKESGTGNTGWVAK